MKHSRITDYLKQDGYVVAIPTGSSMWPMLRAKHDSVVLEPLQGRLQRRQVALVQQADGQYVLHRVVEVHDQDYLLCGDNQWIPAPHAGDAQIRGVVSGFFRGSRYIACNSRLYRFYSWLWCSVWPVRRIFLRFFALVRRISNLLVGEVQHLAGPDLPIGKRLNNKNNRRKK